MVCPLFFSLVFDCLEASTQPQITSHGHSTLPSGEALASQVEIHGPWGGVVPNLAQEAHKVWRHTTRSIPQSFISRFISRFVSDVYV